MLNLMLELKLDSKSGEKEKCFYNNQAQIITAIVDRYHDCPGISKRTLDDKFPMAQKSLVSTKISLDSK